MTIDTRRLDGYTGDGINIRILTANAADAENGWKIKCW